MSKRDLTRRLNDAAKAMPASERRKFRAVLAGGRALPRDGLPARTISCPARKPHRRRAYHQIAPAHQLRLL